MSPTPPNLNLSTLLKPLSLPPNFSAPLLLHHHSLKHKRRLYAEPLSRPHLQADLVAVNSSLALIRRTRGGSWPDPTSPLTEEYNWLDLCWHEREFRDGSSFAYAVFNVPEAERAEGNPNGDPIAEPKTEGEYVGCFYLYPIGTLTALSAQTLEYDVDASWWVTAAAYERGLYGELYRALGAWLRDGFPFKRVWYSNREIPGV